MSESKIDHALQKAEHYLMLAVSTPEKDAADKYLTVADTWVDIAMVHMAREAHE